MNSTIFVFTIFFFPFSLSASRCYVISYPSTQNQTLQNSKHLQTTNFKFDKDGGKFSKIVENNVEKGEIAHYEQFLLFTQYF